MVSRSKLIINKGTERFFEPIYDAAGTYVGNSQITAYGPSSPQPKPVLRIVGEPGIYSMSAYGYVNGTRTEFASFSLELLVPVNTPPAQNVTVTPSEDLTLVFDNVITGGSNHGYKVSYRPGSSLWIQGNGTRRGTHLL